jgi:putative ABC transport system permease protein
MFDNTAMFSTQCPTCRSYFRLHHGVAETQGIVECTKCATVFDAMRSSQDQVEGSPAAAPQSELSGDRAVYRGPSIPNAKPWSPYKQIRISSDDDSAAASSGGGGWLLAGYFGLALRNLFRNRRRSMVSLLITGVGVISIILAGGFIEWVLYSMREVAIYSDTGHMQVVRAGYFRAGAAAPYDYLLADDDAALPQIEQLEDVKLVAPRLYLSGLVSKDEATISFIAHAVDPDKEAILAKEVNIGEGQNLAADNPHGIVVGKGLAANLGVKVGDTVVLLANTEGGGVNAIEATVSGIFWTMVKAFDDTAIRMTIEAGHELVRTTGSHAWLVLLHDTERSKQAVESVRTILDSGAAVAGASADKEVFGWFDLADFYLKTEQLYSSQVRLVWLAIGMLILLTISNTMMMNVLERTREIGTVMALGRSRREVLKMFLHEGLVLGVVGAGGGVIIGCVLAVAISTVGIPMPPPPGSDIGFNAELRLTPALVIAAFLVGQIATTLAAILPARKASALRIVDALRHNR